MSNLPPLPLVDGVFIIDNSALEKFQNCPRDFEYSHLRKRALAAERAGRNFGSAIHVGLAVRYRHGGNGVPDADVRSVAESQMLVHFENNPQPADDFRNYDHACKTLSAYYEQYPSESFNILKNSKDDPMVESTFLLHLGEVQGVPIAYAGKIDLGIANNDGTWSFDTKTTFQFGQGFDDDMAMNGGQLGYCWALGQLLGRPANGYIINAIRVRRPKKSDEYTGTAPVDGTDFKRLPFFVTPDALDEWKADTLAMVSDIFWMHDRSFYPRHRKHCVGKYGRCDFYECCNVPRASRENVLTSTLFEENEWTPLNKPL